MTQYTAVITGGSKGLGVEQVRRFLESGCKVYVVANMRGDLVTRLRIAAPLTVVRCKFLRSVALPALAIFGRQGCGVIVIGGCVGH